METTPRGRPGPPHRGRRKPALIRIPEEHYEIYLAEGERQGYRYFGDYLNATLARVHGLEVPDFAKPVTTVGARQDQLPQAG